MEVTILGSANPCPQPERAGTGIGVSVGDATLLVDCGPLVTYRLIESGIDITDVRDVFFTHHHMDHNVDFFHFALVSWYLGRRDLTVYGPAGTRDLIEGFETAYDRHIEDTTQWRHEPPDGLTDIEVVDVTDGFAAAGDGWEVSALPVEHAYAMDVYAYRFEEPATGATFVFSGDTTPLDSMVEFAAGADVLVHDCNITGETETPLGAGEVHDRYLQPPYEDYFGWVFGDDAQDELSDQLHTSPREAGEIAEAAGVDTLVLTHLNARRNPADIEREAAAAFSGETVAAEDGLVVSA